MQRSPELITPNGNSSQTAFKTRNPPQPHLTTLLEIGETLAGIKGLKSAIGDVLALLDRYHGMLCGVVMLRDAETDELRVIASHGISDDLARQISYRVGDGITGRVAQSGKPIVVPQISREPMFLDRLGLRKDGLG